MNISGYIDDCNELGFNGWVLDEDDPHTKQQLIVKCGNSVLGSSKAVVFRRDLAEAGLADGFCAFQFNFSKELSADQLAMIKIGIAGTEQFFPLRIGRPVTGLAAHELYNQSASACSRIGRKWCRFPLCILHIGTEKTGSTSLQHWLGVNRAVLGQAGYLVPRTFASSEDEDTLNHTKLALISMHERNFADDLRQQELVLDRNALDRARHDIFMRFSAEAERNIDCHTLVLSNEHCHSRLSMPDEVQNLKDFLDHFCEQYKIVIFLRPQHELAISQYGMFVTNGVRNLDMLPPLPPPPGYLKEVYTNKSYFDYDALIQRWSRVFGEEAIRLHIYDRDVIGIFERNFSLPTGKLVRTERRHLSTSAKGQAFLTVFYQCLEGMSQEEVNVLSERVRDLVQTCFPGAGPLPAREAVVSFLEQFSSGNERIRARWMPERKQLFEVDVGQYPEVEEPIVLTVDEVMKIFIKMLLVEGEPGLPSCRA